MRCFPINFEIKEEEGCKGMSERNKKSLSFAMSLTPIYMVILALYPMRHIHWGLDFWDTGYSYANFEYMGLEHMDSMWLFATYLTNVVGHFLTLLPMGDSLIGMNFYTGLVVSFLALVGFFFCTKKMDMSPFSAFVGEMIAISLCWCPTASFYNYLTFVFLLCGTICLYLGLVESKRSYLILAGICLGTNVLVRFSNIPEAGLIVAVWAYGILEWIEERGVITKGKSILRRTVERTWFCFLGYSVALVAWFLHIHLRYGIGFYVESIQRLFDMTDHATDYKATSMVMALFQDYGENLYWVFRIIFVIIVGVFFFWFTHLMVSWLEKTYVSHRIATVIWTVVKLVWFVVACSVIGWLYVRQVFSFTSYQQGAAAIYRTGILFLTAALLIAILDVFQLKKSKEQKLISGMLVLIILLTSLGSNNRAFPSINNLYLVAPYMVWKFILFSKHVYEKKWAQVVSFPVKAVLFTLLITFIVHSVHFGAYFMFEEALGAKNLTATVENNSVLRGIKMSPERAKWMTEISAYVNEKNLQGREVILYGWIPALSYYLQMPSAFNPWSDLRSYSYEKMEQDLEETEIMCREKGLEEPIVITTAHYADVYEEFQRGDKKTEEDTKWNLLMQFMERVGYEKTFVNERFVIWEACKS